jgi:hypothetical protein
MPYADATVYVEDRTGDLGGPPTTSAPWWLSPDVDIPAHSGEAVQGSNDVQIRVHTHEEPILTEKVVAEVYVGAPGFVLSPSTGTKRIDPGNLLFRPPGVAGSEPVADIAGATLTFAWTPSSSSAAVDGPGHRCLIVRAFPQSLTPPTSPFDVPNEQHEAQHNIEILSTTKKRANMAHGGAGTPHDPRRRDTKTGMWWEVFSTMAAGKRGRRYIVWAFDPDPNLDPYLTFSKHPPDKVSLEGGEEIDPRELLKDGPFAEQSGLGRGLWSKDRLLAGLAVELDPRVLAHVPLLFDHSNLAPHTAVVLHGAQWDEHGRPEGGMTVVALAPV